jgi:hypothetical protein
LPFPLLSDGSSLEFSLDPPNIYVVHISGEMPPKPKKWRKVLDTWERAVYRFEHRQGLWVEIGFDKKKRAFGSCRIGHGTGPTESEVARPSFGPFRDPGTAKSRALEVLLESIV